MLISKTTRLLLIIENAADASLLKLDLYNVKGQDLGIVWSQHIDEALMEIREQLFDAILFDISHKISTNESAFVQIQRVAPNTPLIVLTNASDEAAGIAAIRQGAQDYLVKGSTNASSIVRSIRYAIERKTTQELIIRAKKEWEQTFDSVPDLIAIIDKEHNILRVNKAMARKLNRTPAECVGFHCIETNNGRSTPPFLTPHSDEITATSDLSYEVHEDSSHKDYHVTISSITDSHNHVFASVRIARDITNHKHIETELAKSRELLETLVHIQQKEIIDTHETLDLETTERLRIEAELSRRQQALEAVYAIGTAFNSSLEAMTDQVAISIAKILMAPLISIRYFLPGVGFSGTTFSHGKLYRSTHEDLNCADQKMQCHACFPRESINACIAVPILSPKSEKYGTICVLDNKNRIFASDDVRFIEIFARYIAHVLSQKEMETQLQRSNEMKTLGQLTSGVAHEVRNPLNGIMAIMGALSKELGSSAQFVPYMQHMRNQVTRLTTLMEELLALGRPLREENMQRLNIVDIVDKAITTWLETVGAPKPSTILIKPENGDSLAIRADKTNLIQMIVNLLENAYNHSLSTPEIICEVRKGDGLKVVLSVTDNGSGIPEAILPKIFDPFFTTRKGGTGLGLSIVRRIVENHKGTIAAFNNLSASGATFEVILPLHTVV